MNSPGILYSHLQQDPSLEKLWCWNQFQLVWFSFLLLEGLGSCKPWPAEQMRAEVISLPKSLKKLRSQCDLCCCCCLRKDFEVWSQHCAPNSSWGLWLWGKSFCSRAGRMWWDSLGFMWQRARIERQQRKKQAGQQNPQEATLCPTKHKSNSYIVAILINFSQPAWNMWPFGMWGKAA